MSELKPCPFCGGEAEIVKFGVDNYWYVICGKCFTHADFFYSERKAIEAWNTRENPIPDTPEMVRALDDAYNAGLAAAKERTCTNIKANTDYTEFRCSLCDCCIDSHIGDYIVWKWCPQCGAKVVEE